VHSDAELIEPHAESIAMPIQMQKTGTGAVDEQTAHIRVAALTNAQQGRLAACGVLLWYES